MRLGGSKIFRCSGSFSAPGGLAALTASAYAKGARISSNSWGASVLGAYNVDAQTYDKLVRDADPATAGNQEMVEVFSAGNDGPGLGTTGAPGNAKNVLTVGAAENVRAGFTDGCGVTNSGADDAHDLINFTSRGPTADGRMKPDVVGPGTHVTGPRGQHGSFTGAGVCDAAFPAGNTFYDWSSGTSHSTPAVAGVAALVREWYRQKQGGGVSVPSPALTKAIIVNSATDLVGGNDGDGATNAGVPNQNQGWGLPSIARALDLGPRVFRDQQDVLGASGESRTLVLAVQDSSKPVRVTLAYTDAFGPTTGNSFVNDLNLTVASRAGTFKGNVFAGGVSVAGGTADPRNNLESVYLPAGTGGSFSVEVTAANIAGDGVPGNADATDQDYALVVSNAAVTSAPVLSAAAATVTPGGDGDGALEPGEDFSVSQPLANSGTGGSSAIAGTLTGPAAVGVTDGSAAWPSLAPGASAANGDALTGVLDAGAACGAPLDASIAITTAEGASATVPVRLTTGTDGAPVARSSTEVPRPIPDNSSAGVDSRLFVATPGFVRDVNVRIASVTHPFDGDLQFELTSPSATTVLLIDRVGGSGDGFASTVLDDEASSTIGVAGGAPFTGSFKPSNDRLSRFDGEPVQGLWTLRVRDLARSDTGTLGGWGHAVSPAECFFAPPGAVGGLSAVASADSVALDWADTATASRYKVLRRQPDGTYPATPTASPVASAFTEGGLAAGTEYCYRVLALNAGGDGPQSGEVCATTPRAPPPPPAPVTGKISLSRIPATIRPTTNGFFSLTFTAPAKAKGSIVITTVAAKTPKPGQSKRKLRFARTSFTVPASGTVKLRLKLQRTNRGVLVRARRVAVRAEVRVGTLSARRSFAFLAPRKTR